MHNLIIMLQGLNVLQNKAFEAKAVKLRMKLAINLVTLNWLSVTTCISCLIKAGQCD